MERERESVRARRSNSWKIQNSGNGGGKDLFRRLAGKQPDRCEEVIVISISSLEEYKKEARQLGVLLDKSILEAMEKGSKDIMRYVVNRLERIKRCLGPKIVDLVKQGDGEATEEALRKILLYSKEGPIIRFKEEKEQ